LDAVLEGGSLSLKQLPSPLKGVYNVSLPLIHVGLDFRIWLTVGGEIPISPHCNLVVLLQTAFGFESVLPATY